MFPLFARRSLSASSTVFEGFSEEICSMYDGNRAVCQKFGCRYTKNSKCHSAISHQSKPIDKKSHFQPGLPPKHVTTPSIDTKSKHICSQHLSEFTCAISRDPQCSWYNSKCVPADSFSEISTPKLIPTKPAIPGYQIDSAVGKIKEIAKIDDDEQNAFFGKKKKQNTCYATYSSRGCPSCHSRDPNISCGWCQSQGFCTEGNVKGATAASCPPEDWIFNQSVCNSEMCSVSRTKSACRSPCRWSTVRNKCTAPITLSEIANGIANGISNTLEKALGKSKPFLIATGVVLGAVVVVAMIGFFVNSYHRHLYQTLPLMKESITLNDIPSL